MFNFAYFDVFCCFLCLLHLIYEFVHSRLLNKKIKTFCEKCNMPVYENEEHKCSLTSEQLKKLSEFILLLKGENNGSK